MDGLNYLAIIVVSLLAFIASIVWYISFGKQLPKLNPKAYGEMKRPKPVEMVIEILRNIILAFVIAYMVHRFGVTSFAGGLALGLILWVGFPVILLSGSVLHEKVPTKLAAIHAGDWLIKIFLMTIILGMWH